MRVLIVEDDEDTADALGALLELDGHEVAVAKDGRSGIEAARGYGPHVVLCDLGLPEVDGWEVCEALRGDPALEHALIIAYSGYGAPGDLERSRGSGFHAHITKPGDIEALRRLLFQIARGERPNVAALPSAWFFAEAEAEADPACDRQEQSR